MKGIYRSLLLSRVITILLLLVCVLCLIFLPTLMEHYFAYRQMPAKLYTPLLTLCYPCALVGFVALSFLYALLSRIARQILFDRRNVALLSWLSFFCLLICLITAVAILWYFPCIIISLAAAFLFLILRVLRYVFAIALDIKDENDMTV